MLSFSPPGVGSSPREGLHPPWLFVQRKGRAGAQPWSPHGDRQGVLPAARAASSQKPAATPSLSPCSFLMPFAPSQNSGVQLLSLVVSWGFISSCRRLLLEVTARQVWLPCRVHIKEHTLLLIFFLLSHGLRLQAAAPLCSRALCLPRHSSVPEMEPS